MFGSVASTGVDFSDPVWVPLIGDVVCDDLKKIFHWITARDVLGDVYNKRLKRNKIQHCYR